MGSSKIQEYNLDPNCGFAKEETAQEILDAVNSMETSLTGELTANVVKSVQHVFYTIPAESSGGTIPISTVDLSKSFVLFELLCEQVTYVKNVSYTLNATNITVSYSPVGNGMDVGAIVYGFWVIEFM